MGYNFSKEAKLTNAQLAGELAKLGPLNEREIAKLLPRKVDKRRFNEIIEIVNNAASQQNKLVELKDNFDELGGVVLKLLIRFLKPL